MADPVTGKNFILYVKLGTGYYPIACAKDISVTTVTDKIELAPYGNGYWRSYIYGRTSGTITGTGITKIDVGASNYSIFDLIGYQTEHFILLSRYTLTDPQGNARQYEVPCLIDEINISASSGANSNYSFTLTMSGDPSFDQTIVNPPLTDVDSFGYTATGGETAISDSVLIGVDVIDVRRNGIGLEVILIGTPTGSQVKFIPATGSLEFTFALGVDEYILVIYVS
jgi:hypothetical protein